MKTKLLSVAFAALAAASLPVSAEEAAKAGSIFITAQKPTEYLVKDRLIGAKVKNSSGEIVGDIEDLIVDNSDHVTGAVMGVGGFLGIGEKKIAVNTSALQLEVTDGKMNVILPAATKDALKGAPAFERSQPKKGILERITEKVEELKDKSTSTAKDAYENAKPAVEKAKEAAKDAYEHAKDAAKDAVEKAKDAAHPAEAPKQ
jgi:ElaB/YqjD/DUF883 family membrane-anchored ribosome-binding protein